MQKVYLRKGDKYINKRFESPLVSLIMCSSLRMGFELFWQSEKRRPGIGSEFVPFAFRYDQTGSICEADDGTNSRVCHLRSATGGYRTFSKIESGVVPGSRTCTE